MATYFINASVSGPTDPDSNWSTDANAFDGSTSTSASDVAVSTTSTKYLRGDGTNAPSLGGVITQVQARIFCTTGVAATYSATIYTAGLAETLGTATATSTLGSGAYGSYATLTAPVAGWSWSAIDGLVTKIWGDGGGLVMKVELEVTAAHTNIGNYGKSITIGDGMSRNEVAN